jgi:hypothetical protein
MFKEFEDLITTLDTAKKYQNEAQEKILKFLLEIDNTLKNHIVNGKILANGDRRLLLAEVEVEGETCKITFDLIQHDLFICADGNCLNIKMASPQHINIVKTLELLKALPYFVREIRKRAEMIKEEVKSIYDAVILLLQQLQ